MDNGTGAAVGAAVGAAIIRVWDYFAEKRKGKPIERQLLKAEGENGSSTIRMMLQRIDERTERTDSRVERMEERQQRHEDRQESHGLRLSRLEAVQGLNGESESEPISRRVRRSEASRG